MTRDLRPPWDGPEEAGPRPWPWIGTESTFAPPEQPPPSQAGRGAGGPRRRIALALAALLVAVSAGLGYLAYHNDQNASGWRRLDLAQVARNRQVGAELNTANQRISTLNGQLATLNTQIGSLQSQLSSVANQKEKAVDQETVLQQLLSAAGQVADALQQCITATNQFSLDLNSAVASGDPSQLPALQNEATKADDTCSRAESANQNLQSAIQSAP